MNELQIKQIMPADDNHVVTYGDGDKSTEIIDWALVEVWEDDRLDRDQPGYTRISPVIIFSGEASPLDEINLHSETFSDPYVTTRKWAETRANEVTA